MMLPCFSDAREFLGRNAMSYSEMQTITHCEKKWSLVYDTQDRERYEATDPMKLGTHMHNLLNMWYGHGPDPALWEDETPDLNPADAETAVWLIDRYDEVYRDAKVEMLATNVPFATNYWGTWLFGWFDGICRDGNGDLWVAEFKTMGDWSRLHQLPMDKQITLYIYAARRAGWNVKGVMFDALLTTHWKTEEGEVYKSGPKKGQPKSYHPPADSFRREYVVRTDEEIEQFLFEVESIVAQRDRLYWGDETPMRNIGKACSWCPVMPKCYGIEIELTDAVADDTLF